MFSLALLNVFACWLMPIAVRDVARQWNNETDPTAKSNALIILVGNSYLLAYTFVQILLKLFS